MLRSYTSTMHLLPNVVQDVTLANFSTLYTKHPQMETSPKKARIQNIWRGLGLRDRTSSHEQVLPPRALKTHSRLILLGALDAYTQD